MMGRMTVFSAGLAGQGSQGQWEKREIQLLLAKNHQ